MIEIIKSEDFEEKKEEFLHKVETNEDIKEAYLTTSFEEGKELLLKIKVADRYLSRILYDLLYSISDYKNVKGTENLGFTLEEIIYNPLEYSEKQKEELKIKLTKDLMENFKSSLDENLK